MLLMHPADKFPRANPNCLNWFHHICVVILLGLLGTAETGENFLEMLLGRPKPALLLLWLA